MQHTQNMTCDLELRCDYGLFTITLYPDRDPLIFSLRASQHTSEARNASAIPDHSKVDVGIVTLSDTICNATTMGGGQPKQQGGCNCHATTWFATICDAATLGGNEPTQKNDPNSYCYTQIPDVLASPRLRVAGYGRDTQPTLVVGNQHTAGIAMSRHTAGLLLTHASRPILSQRFSAIFPQARFS